MKSTMRLYVCLLVGCAALTSSAQQAESVLQSLHHANDPAQAGSASEDQAHVTEEQPPREIKFEVSDEELELKLFRADPELFNQHFAVDVEISVPNSQDFSQLRRPIEPEPWSNLGWCQNYYLLKYGRTKSTTKRESLHDFFEKLAGSLENGSANPPSGMDFFLSDASRDGRVMFSVRPVSPPMGYFRFRILAPTEQLARERAEALVQILDRSIRLPLLKHLQDQVSSSAKAIAMFEEKLPSAVTKVKKLDEEVFATKESAIDADELKRLTTERRLLDVDLAGIRARINAAEEIIRKLDDLSSRDVGRSRIEQLENIKVTAEIDLAGLAARRKVLDGMIQAGKDREALVAKRNEAHEGVDRMHANINLLQNKLQYSRNSLIVYSEKLFSLKDNKIVIHPIKWAGTE